MPVPIAIKVGATTYDVAVKKRLPENRYGDTRNGIASIRLNKVMTLGPTQDTLLHEVLHAVVHVSGMQNVLEFSDESEEKMIRILTPWILGVIRDNPELIEYLTEGDR